MKFEFAGRTYRIRFKHDRPRELSAHVTHEVGITTKGVLVCHTCTVQYDAADGSPAEFFRLTHVSKCQRERQVACVIESLVAEQWIVTTAGIGRVNKKAGDRFTRCGGRTAAIRNAIASMVPEFKNAVWAAYNARKAA